MEQCLHVLELLLLDPHHLFADVIRRKLSLELLNLLPQFVGMVSLRLESSESLRRRPLATLCGDIQRIKR